MTDESIWRTWKPYAVIAAVAVGGFWWYSTQSSIAGLKDGPYACTGVFVNEDGKYEILTDDTGDTYTGAASIENGELVALSGDSSLSSSQLSSLTMRTKGNSSFHVTDDPAMHSYYAVACEYSG